MTDTENQKINAHKKQNTGTVFSRLGLRLFRRRAFHLPRFYWPLPSATLWQQQKFDNNSGAKIDRLFRWNLTARILSINLLVLIIPLYGFVRADSYRSSLIDIELSSMAAEGQIVAKAIGATADQLPMDFAPNAITGQFEGLGSLRGITTPVLSLNSRRQLRQLTSNIESRMRLFNAQGELIADTRYMGPGNNPVRVDPLEPESSQNSFSKSLNKLFNQLLGRGPFQPYSEPEIDTASHYNVTSTASLGEVAIDVQLDDNGGLVFLVAVPVQEYRQVIGTLLISRDQTGVEASVRQLRGEAVRVTFLTLAVTITLSILLANTIARPIRRLAINAIGVARSKRRQVEITDLRYRRDEIGDLSFATRRMTEALWDRLDATDAFAADVSHELKNPLTSLKSAVETMQAYPDSPRKNELLDIINHDVNRMDRLITEISRSSRVDTEISRMEWQHLDMVALTENLLDARAILDPHRSQHSRFHLDIASLPQDQPAMVRAIGDKIAQVLNNLLDNAETFSPPDGKIAIRIERLHAPNRIRTSVIDQGSGIPADRLARVFERFYTDRPESDGFGNHSGLGLSIVKQIVEGHNGHIWADNADENDDAMGYAGAKFIFELPAA